MPRIDFWWSQACPSRLISKECPEEYTITHFAGGAMLKYFTSTFSSSCSVPIWTYIFGTKKQQKQNNQFINTNQLSQTNIVLSKINFQCVMLCSYCLHKFAGLDFSGLISMECAFPSQSRCKNLVRIDSVSTKVQVGNTRRLSVDREAFSAFYARA